MAKHTGATIPSAAFSDLCLTTMCFASAFVLVNTKARLQDTCLLSAFGLTMIGAAAGVGTLRFGFYPQLVDVHSLAARIASAVGMPMFAIGISCSASDGLLPPLHWVAKIASPFGAVTLATMILTVFIGSKWSPAAADLGCQIFGGLSVLLLLFTSFTLGQRAALLSSLCIAVGGLFGAAGESWGILNVNWFHYLLVTSIGFGVLQLLKRPVI